MLCCNLLYCIDACIPHISSTGTCACHGLASLVDGYPDCACDVAALADPCPAAQQQSGNRHTPQPIMKTAAGLVGMRSGQGIDVICPYMVCPRGKKGGGDFFLASGPDIPNFAPRHNFFFFLIKR